MDNAISVRHLSRHFDTGQQGTVIANDDLCFEVPRGSVFGILGENGAGKTTLVHQLLGLLQPTSGEIWMEGVDVGRFPDRVKPLVGFLPQSAVPLRYVDVRHALEFTGRLRGQLAAPARRQADELLERLDLTPYAGRFVHKLSGGLMRTTNFAMALMGYPRIVVLDEPTNNLDPARRRQIWETLRAMNAEKSLTCVLVTHNLLEAETVLQQMCVMRHGKIIAQGTPGELKSVFAHRARLEFRLKASYALPESVEHTLSQYGQLDALDDGRSVLVTDGHGLSAALDILVHTIGLDQVDDFHAAPPSLEDVYLYLQTQPAYA